MLDGEASLNWSSTRQNGPVSPSCKWTQGKPAKSAAYAERRVSTKISVYGLTCVFPVGVCSTETTTLRSISSTEGLDGAHVKLSLRVRSVGLLREAPAVSGRGSRHNRDKAVGYLVITFGYSLEYHGQDAFIDELFIEANYRHQGIGTKAMEFALEACRELGIHALYLEVERANIAGQALYRKFGFEDSDRYLLTRRLEEERTDQRDS